jgi:hypothetical protein
MTKDTARGRGRPRKHGERVPLGLRVTPDLKAKLDQAALASGRSQSQEAELRLEHTFNAAHAVFDALDLAYGRKLTGLLLAIARLAQITGTRGVFLSRADIAGGEDWLSDPYAYDQAVRAIGFLLEAFRPKGKIIAPRDTMGLPEAAYERLGEGFALDLIAALRNSAAKTVSEEVVQPISERLDDMPIHPPPDAAIDKTGDRKPSAQPRRRDRK